MADNGNVSTDTRKERFLGLLEPVYGRFESFAFAMCDDPEQARDLIAETMLRAYEHFDEMRDDAAFLAYLYSIAGRHQKRQWWRRRIWRDFDEQQALSVADAGTSPEAQAEIRLLYDALARLPFRQRQAIVLFEIAGLPQEEIRSIQGGSLSGVKVRIHRARRRLEQLLVAADEALPSEQHNHRPDDQNLNIALRTATHE